MAAFAKLEFGIGMAISGDLVIQSRILIDWPVDKLIARFLKSSYPAATKTLTQEDMIESTNGQSSVAIRGESKGKAER